MSTPAVQFDVTGARQAGYSDDEILQHLTQTRKFDVQGALKAGYSQQEIINHLSGSQDSNATPEAQPETRQWMTSSGKAVDAPQEGSYWTRPGATYTDEQGKPLAPSISKIPSLWQRTKNAVSSELADLLIRKPEDIGTVAGGLAGGALTESPFGMPAGSAIGAATGRVVSNITQSVSPHLRMLARNQAASGAASAPPPLPQSNLEAAGQVVGAGARGAAAGFGGAAVEPLIGAGVQGFSEVARPPVRVPKMAAEVSPKQVEAFTASMDKAGVGPQDIHEEISTPAAPLLRDQAARMGVKPTQFEGRAGNKLGLKIADSAVNAHEAEVAQISKPYLDQQVSQAPIAQAYRSKVTPELASNEPQVAARLEAEAQKFDGQASLKDVNDFRVRMNKENTAYEKKPTGKQVSSDVEAQANKAAADAARTVQYGALEQMSGLEPDYVRNLMKREGALIEYRNSLEQNINKISPRQAEAATKTLREKLAGVRPSRTGVEHHIIQETFGLQPTDALNARLKTAYSELGEAKPIPRYELQSNSQPGGEVGGVDSGEVRATVAAQQARRQVGSMANTLPSSIVKPTNPVANVGSIANNIPERVLRPVPRPDVPSVPRLQRVYNTPTDVMMAAKNGDISPADAARLTQKMRGKAGTITKPIVPPIPMRRAGNDR